MTSRNYTLVSDTSAQFSEAESEVEEK